METLPPATALAQAQKWLRTVTNKELRQWRYDEIPDTTVVEQREAGSVEPEYDPWHAEQEQTLDAGRLAKQNSNNSEQAGYICVSDNCEESLRARSPHTFCQSA